MDAKQIAKKQDTGVRYATAEELRAAAKLALAKHGEAFRALAHR